MPKSEEVANEAVAMQEAKLIAAVKSLREALDESQQDFAARLGIAISSAVRYESSRAPSGGVLSKLYWAAANNGHFAIAEMFKQAVFDEWRNWAAIPQSETTAVNLENRLIHALAGNLSPQGGAADRLAQWSFMRSSQKILVDKKYQHLKAPFAEMAVVMCDDLVQEARQALSVILEGAPLGEELMQALMVRFVKLLPPELLGPPPTKKTKSI